MPEKLNVIGTTLQYIFGGTCWKKWSYACVCQVSSFLL